MAFDSCGEHLVQRREVAGERGDHAVFTGAEMVNGIGTVHGDVSHAGGGIADSIQGAVGVGYAQDEEGGAASGAVGVGAEDGAGDAAGGGWRA